MTEVVDARSAFNEPHGTVAPNDPIRHAVTADHARIRDLINEYSRVYRLLKSDFDTLGYGAHLYEISRQIKDAFHQLESSLKNVLINEMTASGCLTTEAGPYKCALRKGAERAQVVNRAELEEWSVKNKRDLFTPQPLKVDLTELGRLLKFGPVPGAILSEGTPTIVISVRK